MALQVQSHNSVPGFFRHVFDRNMLGDGAGIVDQNIDFSEFLGDGVNDITYLVDIGYIAFQRQSLDAFRSYFGDSIFRGIDIDIGDGNGTTFFGTL